MSWPRAAIAASEPILPLILRRDRLPALAGLVGVTALAWLYLLWMAHAMPGDMAGMRRRHGRCR